MPPSQVLDTLPIAAVFLVFALVAMGAYEAGFRLGRWWQDRTPGEQEGPTNMLVGSILALLAFLLAVTMGMASDRYDARRALVVDEANSIGTTYLRAGYLPEPASSQIRELLRQYVPLRLTVTGSADTEADISASTAIHTKLWAIAEEVARTTEKGDLVALFIELLNETIDLHETRITARNARVPETVVLLLIGGVDPEPGDGRLQRRPDPPAQPAQRRGPGHRPRRGHHDRRRPRPAARGPHPGEPTATHRSAAADRAAVVDEAGGRPDQRPAVFLVQDALGRFGARLRRLALEDVLERDGGHRAQERPIR